MKFETEFIATHRATNSVSSFIAFLTEVKHGALFAKQIKQPKNSSVVKNGFALTMEKMTSRNFR